MLIVNFATVKAIISFLLLPFSYVYGAIVALRNFMFEKELFKSFDPEVFTICVGNLQAGGSGKTPQTQWLLEKLGKNYRVAVLSRGYGRKSKGFKRVLPNGAASEFGDEPLQTAKQYTHIPCFVCEDRLDGIRQILVEHPDTEIVVMDDGFQHRWVKPHFSFLLTDYHLPYFKDRLLPSGRLREPARQSQRASVVVVTKCEALPDEKQREKWRKNLSIQPSQIVVFSKISYMQPLCVRGNLTSLEKKQRVYLVTGLANAMPLEEYISGNFTLTGHMAYRDHFPYGERQARVITRKAHENDAVIVTTAKDWVKLAPFADMVKMPSVFVIPIAPYFSDADTTAVLAEMQNAITTFATQNENS